MNPRRLKLTRCSPLIVLGCFGLNALSAQPLGTIGAQSYPVRPVRMIVPYAPGGSSDIIARLLAQRVSETLAQTFVVDNRPGAGGMIGTSLLAKSVADGYTL